MVPVQGDADRNQDTAIRPPDGQRRQSESTLDQSDGDSEEEDAEPCPAALTAVLQGGKLAGEVQSISLVRCNLTQLPPALRKLPHLKTLDLSNNRLDRLDTSTFNKRFTCITELDLSRNRLQTLSDIQRLGLHPSLQNLCITNNPLPFLSARSALLSALLLDNPFSPAGDFSELVKPISALHAVSKGQDRPVDQGKGVLSNSRRGTLKHHGIEPGVTRPSQALSILRNTVGHTAVYFDSNQAKVPRPGPFRYLTVLNNASITVDDLDYAAMEAAHTPNGANTTSSAFDDKQVTTCSQKPILRAGTDKYGTQNIKQRPASAPGIKKAWKPTKASNRFHDVPVSGKDVDEEDIKRVCHIAKEYKIPPYTPSINQVDKDAQRLRTLRQKRDTKQRLQRLLRYGDIDFDPYDSDQEDDVVELPPQAESPRDRELLGEVASGQLGQSDANGSSSQIAGRSKLQDQIDSLPVRKRAAVIAAEDTRHTIERKTDEMMRRSNYVRTHESQQLPTQLSVKEDSKAQLKANILSQMKREELCINDTADAVERWDFEGTQQGLQKIGQTDDSSGASFGLREFLEMELHNQKKITDETLETVDKRKKLNRSHADKVSLRQQQRQANDGVMEGVEELFMATNVDTRQIENEQQAQMRLNSEAAVRSVKYMIYLEQRKVHQQEEKEKYKTHLARLKDIKRGIDYEAIDKRVNQNAEAMQRVVKRRSDLEEKRRAEERRSRLDFLEMDESGGLPGFKESNSSSNLRTGQPSSNAMKSSVFRNAIPPHTTIDNVDSILQGGAKANSSESFSDMMLSCLHARATLRSDLKELNKYKHDLVKDEIQFDEARLANSSRIDDLIRRSGFGEHTQHAVHIDGQEIQYSSEFKSVDRDVNLAQRTFNRSNRLLASKRLVTDASGNQLPGRRLLNRLPKNTN